MNPRKVWPRRLAWALGLFLLLAIGARAMISLSGVLRLTPLSVTVTPAATLSSDLQSLETQTVGQAFDRDTTTSYRAYGKSQLKVTFDTVEELHRLKVFGPAPYVMSVSMMDAKGNLSPVVGWTNVNLNGLSSGWNNIDLDNPVPASSLVISLNPTVTIVSKTPGIPEIEFWGKGFAQNVKGGLDWESLWNGTTPSSPATLMMSGREYDSTDGVLSVGGLGGPSAASMTVNLPLDGKSYRKAWLLYDIEGLSNWIAVPRTINGEESAGGWPLPGSGDWTTQAEAIHPSWLVQGQNTITFTMPLGVVTPYQVKNLRVIVEGDNGANLIDQVSASAGDATVLLDGDETTGWRPYVDGGQSPSLTLNLYRTVSVDTVKVYLDKAITGQVVVGVLQGGTWNSLGDAVNGGGLAAGWQDIPVKAQGGVDAISLSFVGGTGSNSIMEAMVEGSGVGQPYGQTVEVSYPKAGEYFGREAYIRGFLGVSDNGSGPAQVMLGPKQVTVSNGQFEGIIGKEDLGLTGTADGDAWAVTITALYPDGTALNQVVQLNQDLSSATASKGFGTYAQKLLPKNTTVIDKMGARIEMLKDALSKMLDLKVVGLHTTDLPPMNPGMTNVTGGQFRGYRFLPHGTQFKSKVKLTIPFDNNLLPAGKKAKDVRTYYFDTNRGTWMPLELSKTDRENGKIESLTKHFTDFVNATITTPSNPQEVNFNPNQIKDIKAADPGAQVNLIEPPQANSNGTANLSYPIEVPPGRKGVQPQLSVAYNSGGGGSWLGTGWDLPIQSITVETRWGVPRYWDGENTNGNNPGNLNEETETYLLNGEMLTEDFGLNNNRSYLAHRGDASSPNADHFLSRPSSDPVTFHTRKESQFQLIVRHGSGTNAAKNYWWEVTDKSGMKSYFGGSPDTGTPDPSTTLTDSVGHIFQWSLKQMKDPHGNSMLYNYAVVSGTQGTEIYYKNITYTGTGSAPGFYEVDFYRSGPINDGPNWVSGFNRLDFPLNAKGGFPRQTMDVLDHITVKIRNGQEIRNYQFSYKTGPFDKTLLTKIQQFGPTVGSSWEVFPGNFHTFCYYDDVQGVTVCDGSTGVANTYNGFTSIGWTPPQTGVQLIPNLPIVDLFLDGKATDLGGEDSTEFGGHLFLGYAPPLSVGKDMSLGGKIGFSNTDGDGKVQLLDLNGDGLPDLIYKQNGGSGALAYFPNTGETISSSVTQGSFGSSNPNILGIQDISKSNTQMTSGGVEVYIGFINGLFNVAGSDNKQTKFFTDVNGDGIPDLVDNSAVFFGSVDPTNGHLTFTGDSGNTANPLCVGAPVSMDPATLPDFATTFNKAATQNPLVDTLKVWTAPYDGTVTINAPATLLPNALMVNPPQDGVRVAIEQALQSQGSFPSSSQNHLIDAAYLTVAGSKLATPASALNTIYTVPVHQYDRIYFRLQSVFDGKYDEVGWDPKIGYTIPSVLDANGLDQTKYDAASDFTLAGRSNITVNMPNSGTVTLGGIFNMNPVSDDIRVLVIQNHTDTSTTTPTTTPVTIFNQFIPGNTTSTTNSILYQVGGITPAGLLEGVVIGAGSSLSIPVVNDLSTPGGHHSDSLQLIVLTDSNINITNIQWAPQLSYTSIVPAAGGAAVTPTSPTVMKVPYDIQFYPETDVEAPQTPFSLAPPFTVSAPLTWIITPQLFLNSSQVTKGNIVLTVKQNGLLVKKQVYGPGITGPALPPPAFVNLGAPLTITTDSTGAGITSGENFFVNLIFSNEDDETMINTATDVQLISQYMDAAHNIAPLPAASPSPQLISDYTLDSPGLPTDVLPAAYRGWSYVAFKSNPPSPITNSSNGQSPTAAFFENPSLALPNASAFPTNPPSEALTNPPDANWTAYMNSVNAATSSMLVVILNPDPATGVWAGPTSEIYDAPTSMQSSRNGPDQINVFDANSLNGTSASSGSGTGPLCHGGAVGSIRLSHTDQTSFGVGAAGGGASASGTHTDGNSYGILDYMDLNGDGYPDILNRSSAQFTLPMGGLEANQKSMMQGTLRTTTFSSNNLGVGGTAGMVVSDAKGRTKSSGNQMQSISLSISGSFGTSDTDAGWDFVDVNGDGLPDKVQFDKNNHLFVQLNNGYSFGPTTYDWTPHDQTLNHTTGTNISVSPGLGFNDGVFGFAGGASAGGSVMTVALNLQDMNGDGLPDVVRNIGNGQFQVYLNTGSGFDSQPVTWNGGSTDSNYAYMSKNKNQSLGGGVYFTIQIPIFLFGSIIINPGGDFSAGGSAPEMSFQDINGDGYPDELTSGTDSSNNIFLHVYRNNWGRTNLLQKVYRPLGATISLNYERDGNTYYNPHSRWNMTRVVVYDGGFNNNVSKGGADYQLTTYKYDLGTANGQPVTAWDRFERDFLGYGIVTKTEHDTTGVSSEAVLLNTPPAIVFSQPYRQTIDQYLNINFYEKGLIASQATNDLAQGTKFKETDDTYDLVDVFTGSNIPLGTQDLSIPTNTLFPRLVQTVSQTFENNTGDMATTETFGYDNLGNVTAYFNSGDASESNSSVSVTVGYSATDSNLTSSYIMNLPETMSVFDVSNTVLRHRTATYSTQGDLVSINQFLADGTSAETDLGYDGFGMPTTQISPVNAQGFRQILNFQWDSTVHSYPTTIIDGLGYVTSFNYNFNFGKPTTEVDENRNQILTTYDDFGRTVTIVGPFEASPLNNFSNHWTIAFIYHPEMYLTGGVPYAHTTHFDPYRDPNDPIETILFTDGLKRAIQTKKDDTIFVARNKAPLDEMTISGRVVFDQVGHTIKQYYPTVEGKSATSVVNGVPQDTPGVGNFAFNIGYDTNASPTKLTYDILDRNLTTVTPDNFGTTIVYDISMDNVLSGQLRTTVTDANSNLKKTYKDIRELITQVREYNGPSTIITTNYTYDPVKEITQVKDVNGNVTAVTYDNLGRRTSLNNPDTGLTQMFFDLAGNMTKKITQNLANEGGNRAIQYRYDADNRMTNIFYPDFPQNNVIYTYGLPNAASNAANRITSIIDASGSVQRLYDVQGNITREVKVLTPPTQVDEPFQFVSGGVTIANSGCATCSNSLSACATCGFGIWTTDPSLTSSNNSGWGRYGLSTGSSCPTCGQGQFIGWGTSNDHSLETAALPLTFVTQYTYDTWGRVQAMTYPDGEVLTYAYDSGGLPKSVTGMLPNKSQVFPYVLRLEYDQFEQRVFLQHGNGTETTYQYRPDNRRLLNLNSLTGPNAFQNFNYTYDPVGNISQISNVIQPLTPGYLLGGPVTQNFGYDGLYRLTHADGAAHAIYDPSCGSTYDSHYSLDMTYDNIHNIVEKKQSANFTQVNNSNNLTIMGPDSRLTYDWQYSYNGPHPHAPTQIGSREFFYDDNGNQLGYDVLPGDCCAGANRNMIWDEENRLYAVGDDDPGVRATDFGDVHFIYNDKGSRVYKIQGGDITAYLNQFYVIEKPQSCDGFVASKHIFIGTNRIASQIVNPKDDQTLAIDQSINPCPNCTNSGCATCTSSSVSVVQSSNMGWGRNVNWSQFSQNIDNQGNLNGTNDQIQFVTSLNDGTPIYSSDSVEGTIVGTIDSCETMTLMTLNPYTSFYEVQYNGQPAYVQAGAVTVGLPSTCKGVWPNSSVMPNNYFVFFYHPDHIGSTGYMSDGNGVLAEHIEYIPFGESWIEQRQGLGLFPSYQFTGKEWDSETSLYYFGARYYDPRTSVWQSPDPILGQYLDGKPNNGVFVSSNLGLYSYVGNNPVILKDPDGNWAGIDDACLIVGGAASGMIAQYAANKITGDSGGYWEAGLTAAVGAETSEYVTPAGGLVAAAATGNLIKQIEGAFKGGGEAPSGFLDSIKSYAGDIATGVIVGKATEFIKGKIIDKPLNKLLNYLNVTGKGSLQQVTKQIGTKLENAQISLKGIKDKTLAKIGGFASIKSTLKVTADTADALIDKGVDKLKEMFKKENDNKE